MSPGLDFSNGHYRRSGSCRCWYNLPLTAAGVIRPYCRFITANLFISAARRPAAMDAPKRNLARSPRPCPRLRPCLRLSPAISTHGRGLVSRRFAPMASGFGRAYFTIFITQGAAGYFESMPSRWRGRAGFGMGLAAGEDRHWLRAALSGLCRSCLLRPRSCCWRAEDDDELHYRRVD